MVVVSSKKCKDKGIDKAKIREPWMIVVPLVKGVREDGEREWEVRWRQRDMWLGNIEVKEAV